MINRSYVLNIRYASFIVIACLSAYISCRSSSSIDHNGYHRSELGTIYKVSFVQSARCSEITHHASDGV